MSDTHEHNTELSQLYVLRLWREAADAPWRAVLRSAAGGERVGFADVEHLILFLLRLMEDPVSLTNEQNECSTEDT